MSESDPKDGKHRMSADDFMAEARALTIKGMRQRAESRKPSALDLMKDMLQQRAAASDSIEQSLERMRALLGDNAAPAREPSPAAPVESPPPPVKPARLSLDEAMRVAVAEREAAKQASAADEPRIIGGRKLWKLADAAEVIAAIPGFGVAPAALLKRALRAAVAGALIVRDLGDGDIRRADNLSEFLGEWLFAEDFNDWLASAGFGEQYRLPDEVAQDEGFPAAPTEPQAGASVGAEAGSVGAGGLRRGWWDIAGPYMVEKLRAGRFATAKELDTALHADAGTDKSPFDRGTGQHRGSLIVRSIGQPLALKTIQNNWQKIRSAAGLA